MKSIIKFVSLSIAALILVAVLVTAVQWTRARNSVPLYSGSYVVHGISSPVRIGRDHHAIPTIQGLAEPDILFGLGFAHAQERFWQMDLARRTAQGRLSELLGPSTRSSDIFTRSFNFAENVERSWAAMSDADKKRLEAYADGVNAAIWGADSPWPAEYFLTLTRPTPWQPQDTLFVWKTIWLNLSANFADELQHARLRFHVNNEFASEYFRPYPEDGHVTMEWSDLALSLGLDSDDVTKPAPMHDAVPGVLGSDDPLQENSNSWTVSGSKSVSGSPLLASDPHLGFSMPGFWYIARLEYSGNVVAGATIPGIPAIIVGFNEFMAWGSTNSGTDTQDFYLEAYNPDDQNEYAVPGGWAGFDVRNELIRVRFSKDVSRQLQTSRHGIVLPSDVFSIPLTDHDKYAVALSWTGLLEIDTSVSALMRVNRAKTTEEFVSGLRNYIGPIQNVTFAHRNGDIGMVVAGLTPVRKPDHQTMGRFPAEGSNPVNDWIGYIPDNFLPIVLNPESGSLVTANARAVPKEYPYFRSGDFASWSRQKRIQDILDSRDKHSVESFMSIQLDTLSPSAESLSQVLLEYLASNEADHWAKAALDGWNGDWSDDGPAPMLYLNWMSNFSKAIYEDELGSLYGRYGTISTHRIEDVLAGDLGHQCDNTNTDAVESCIELLRSSLETTISTLEQANGDIDKLSWTGYMEPHNHLGFGGVPVLRHFFSRETHRTVGPDAPNVGYFRTSALPSLQGRGFGPTLRMIVELGPSTESLVSISSGQSGHFRSPHYDDLQEPWRNGEYIGLSTSSMAEIVDEITLNPAE